MRTCKDCQKLVDETVKKWGKLPVEKYRCQERSKARKPTDPACMLFREKDGDNND